MSRNRPTQTAPAHHKPDNYQNASGKKDAEAPLSKKTHSTQDCSNNDRNAPAAGSSSRHSDPRFIEIEPTDTFNGSQVIKRGAVTITTSLLGFSEQRQLLLCGNQTLFILKTPSQLLKSLSAEQIEKLRRERHSFYLESSHLLDMAEINEKKEASERFNIYEDMVESYIYLNKGHFKVAMSSAYNNSFEVRTED